MANISKTAFHQIEHPLVQETYCSKENFLIIDENSPSSNPPIACIYFSSNGIYFPNTEESFEKFIKLDHFEWKANKLPNISKHIFLRDVFKQWYLFGINAEINSIEKIGIFLKEKLRGHEIITVGSSSGGYMAMLIGRMLNACKIFCFNGQFNIWDQVTVAKNRLKNPLLVNLETENSYNTYFNLVPHLDKRNSPIFYFCSTLSSWDNSQKERAKELQQFYPFYIKSDIHGIPFYKQNLNTILSATNEDLMTWSRKREYSKFLFSVRIEGIFKSLKYYKWNR